MALRSIISKQLHLGKWVAGIRGNNSSIRFAGHADTQGLFPSITKSIERTMGRTSIPVPGICVNGCYRND